MTIVPPSKSLTSFGETMRTRRSSCLHDGSLTTAVTQSINRYGLITPASMSSLRPDLFKHPGAARELLRDLSHEGLILEDTLYKGHAFYYRREQPYSEPSKIRAYAMLVICAARSANRTKLTRTEFQQYFPEMCRPGLPMNYYVDLTAANPVLGFVRADLGGHGRWDRIVAKALNDARKHRLEPAFDRFVERGALEIRIITALPQKGNRICRALADHPNPSGLPIQVSVVPELINLIAPIPRQATA